MRTMGIRAAIVTLAGLFGMGCLGPAFTSAPEGLAEQAGDAGAVARVDPPASASDAGSTTDAHVPGLDVAVPDAAPDLDGYVPPPSSAVQKCLATCTAGCCDAAGACNVGHSDAVCGTRVSRADGMCQDCAAVGAFCNSAQECQLVKVVCSPQTCGGCCDSNGNCTLGTDDTSCGESGASCLDCTVGGNVCGNNGACVAPSPPSSCEAAACPACTQGTPTCQPTCKCCLDGICL